ncbi:hypothetical protein [Streptomyces thermoviolaceus]|uniref:hypothetical protein n=1 Tax=Streptomyces thermoviolaceus TaxID=1952 RepID=UPI001671AA3F|nr:hypothetical protein [Streptomyces thermoviolaceus]GGV63253.1 hypothetical protein GCM10010499_05880 [Streptomyces thermoviolaceus subsp. apingens]
MHDHTENGAHVTARGPHDDAPELDPTEARGAPAEPQAPDDGEPAPQDAPGAYADEDDGGAVQAAADAGDDRVVAREENAPSAGTAAQPAGAAPGEACDVFLDVPLLKVDEIDLEVEDLRARVSLQAEVLDLLKLNVGADVVLGRVHLGISGVEAQARLTVRLDNVASIINRVLTTLDRNPEILRELARGVGSAVQDVGGGARQAVGELGTGAGRAVEDVGRGAGSAVEDVGRGAGSAVEDLGRGAESAVGDVGRGAGSAVGDVGRSAGSAVEGVGRGAGGAVTDVGRGVGAGVEGAAEDVGAAVQGVSGGAEAAVGDVAREAGNVAGSAGDVAGSAGGVVEGSAGEATGGTRRGVGGERGRGVRSQGGARSRRLRAEGRRDDGTAETPRKPSRPARRSVRDRDEPP